MCGKQSSRTQGWVATACAIQRLLFLVRNPKPENAAVGPKYAEAGVKFGASKWFVMRRVEIKSDTVSRRACAVAVSEAF